MKNENCPNCGRSLTEDEIYCYFCEFGAENLGKKEKTKTKNKPAGRIK